MKALTIFFVASSVIAEPFIKSCGEFNVINWNRDDRVDFFNHWRRGIMNEIGVSNMTELQYNPNLEDELRKMKSCEDINHGSNYRVDKETDLQSKRIVQNLIKNVKDQGPREFWPKVAEHLNPAQTFVAWCHLNVKCKGEYVDDKNEKKTYEKDNVVIFGPTGTYSESYFKIGKPGSDCPNGVVPPKTPNGRCDSNCGLCKGPEVPVKTTTARTMIQSKEGAAENSIDADSAAPVVSLFLILPISLVMHFV